MSIHLRKILLNFSKTKIFTRNIYNINNEKNISIIPRHKNYKIWLLGTLSSVMICTPIIFMIISLYNYNKLILKKKNKYIFIK